MNGIQGLLTPEMTRDRALQPVRGPLDAKLIGFWFCNFSHEEVEALLRELHGRGEAELTSETLVVR